jgi:hypothetical protein
MKKSIRFERIHKVTLPYDLRNEDPSKNYGIHGMDVWFVLKGPKGAVQFMFTVQAYLPHVKAEFDAKDQRSVIGDMFIGCDLGYHALEPQYEGQRPLGKCDLFPGRECYYDGSSSIAYEWARELFATRGSRLEPIVWQRLEQEYEDQFGLDAEAESVMLQ